MAAHSKATKCCFIMWMAGNGYDNLRTGEMAHIGRSPAVDWDMLMIIEKR